MDDYQVKGRATPDMTSAAFVAVLRAAQSPVSAAEAEAVYAYTSARCVSPAWLLAVFAHESGMGKAGTATQTHSWGNTRPPTFGAPSSGAVSGRSGQFSVYADWAYGGVSTVARVCDHPAYAKATTVRQITTIWAPPTDSNDTGTYIAAVLAAIAIYALPQPPGPTKGATMPVPKPATVQHPSPNRNGYAGTRRVDAVVWHVTAGGEAGSLSWLTSPASSASANYLIGKDGTIYELVPPDQDAWANGQVDKPATGNPVIAGWLTEGVNFNQRTVSIETVRETSANEQPGGFTVPQYKSLVSLTAWLCDSFNLTPDRTHIIRHGQIDSVNKPHCPGLAESEMTAMVMAISALVNGATPPAAPVAMLDPVVTERQVWQGKGRLIREVITVINDDTGKYYEQTKEYTATGPVLSGYKEV